MYVTRINFNLKYILLLNYILKISSAIYVLLEIFLIFETILSIITQLVLKVPKLYSKWLEQAKKKKKKEVE